MKKIALISHSDDLHGAEKMLLHLALLLREEGVFSPILFIPNGSGLFRDEAVKHNLQYYSYESAPWHIYKTSFNDYFTAFHFSYSSLRSILIENPCDLVLVNTHVNAVPVNLAVEFDVPLIVWSHGVIDASMVEPTIEFSYIINKWVLNTATKLVVVSKWTGEYYRYFYSSRDYEVIPNWLSEVPLDDYSALKSKSGNFICLGSHEDIKGIDVLIDAAILLKKKGYSFKIDLFGDGPLYDQHKNKIKKHSLTRNVQLHGFVSDVKSLYRDKLCVISPSFVDSFGLTLIEGMSNKIPAIATRSGGAEEIIEDGVTGFLVDRGDYVAMAEKMMFFLQNPDKAEKMGNAGYYVFEERFSKQSAKAKVHSVLNATLISYKGYNQDVKFTSEFFNGLMAVVLNEKETLLNHKNLKADLGFETIIRRNRSWLLPPGSLQERFARFIYSRFFLKSNT